MNKAELNCLYFPDLLPWERSSVAPIIEGLSEQHSVNQIEVGRSHRGLLRRDDGSINWILSSDWREALRFLGVRSARAGLWASVFGLPAPTGNLFTVLWRHLMPDLPPIRLLTHSSINFRFYRELVKVQPRELGFLPLPYSQQLKAELGGIVRPSSGRLVVGTFAPFTSESNLNYFVNVAHYVRRLRANVSFRILGSGILYPHLSRMVQQMNLEDCVSVVEAVTHEDISGLDMLLYVPLRNDHFIPILVAAAAGIPVLSSEIPGVDQFIQDGKSGFIVPCNETKPMGELVIRLLDHEPLRKSIAQELQSHIATQFSAGRLVGEYESCLFGNPERAQIARAA